MRNSFEQGADLNERTLAKLHQLNLELSLENNNSKRSISPPCYVEVRFDGENYNEEYYIVENTVQISGVTLVSPDAPLARSVMGRSAGDKFSISSTGGQVKRVG